MTVEEVRTAPPTYEETHRFRVVERKVGPADPAFDQEHSHEVHFYVGGKWMRVMLEEL